MRSFLISVALIAVVWVCSSCGTQVYLHKWQPAKVDLPRGTVLRVQAEVDGPMYTELNRAFVQQIARDGFYSVEGYGPFADIRLHRMQVHFTEPAKDSKCCTRPHPNGVELTADLVSNYQRIYRREFLQYVSTDCNCRSDWEKAAEEIAGEVMWDLTPHMVRYSETVDDVDENPAVKQAALACAAGNWEGGRELAQRALEKNPNEAEAYYVLGLIERNARNYAASDDYFRKAYSLDSQSKYRAALNNNTYQQNEEARAHSQMNRWY